MSSRLGGGVVVLVAITLFLALQAVSGTAEASSPVKVAEVSGKFQVQSRQFPAKVVASSAADLATKVGGQVEAIYFQPGDKVKQGQVLLQIDATDYQLGYEQAQANLTLAQATYNRVYSSFKKGASTQADLDNVRAQLDLANIALQQARNSLADTALVAPYDGVIVRVTPELHEFVAPQSPLIYLQSQQAILVDFQLPSDIIARTNVNELSPITVRFDAFPEQAFVAEVKEFSTESDTTTRGYDVTLTMPLLEDKSINVLPGMDATVELFLDKKSHSSTVMVPNQAVFLQQQQPSVWLLDGDRVVRQVVSLGALSENGIEILEGLSAGQQIVVAGVHQLTENQQVTVWAGK